MAYLPQRTCVGCGSKKAQQELARLSRAGTMDLALNSAVRSPGRGVYVCANLGCLELAFKKRALERALKLSGGLSPEQKENLRREVQQKEQYDRAE